MSDGAFVLAVFWVAFLLDGLRRLRRGALAVSRAAPWPAAVRHQALHALPPAPWAWRLWADDPPVAVSPSGLCNQPVGTAGRPADRPAFTRVWRWEEVDTAVARDGWLWINGERFAPSAAAFPAKDWLRLATELKALPTAARPARLRRQIAQWWRPAHWRRRCELVRRVSRWPALANGLTVATAAVASLAAVAAEVGVPQAMAEGLATRLPWLLAAVAIGYLGGLVLAVVAARRLRRWTRPGVVKTILGAAFFPPQGLRWRRVLTDAGWPAPHPLLVGLACGSRAVRTELAFNTLADLRWPVPLPERAGSPVEHRPDGPASGGDALPAHAVTLAAADEIRVWQAGEFARVLLPWLKQAGLDPEELLAAPARDGATSVAYCPRCGSQFVRLDGHCPRGVPLVPLRK